MIDKKTEKYMAKRMLQAEKDARQLKHFITSHKSKILLLTLVFQMFAAWYVLFDSPIAIFEGPYHFQFTDCRPDLVVDHGEVVCDFERTSTHSVVKIRNSNLLIQYR